MDTSTLAKRVAHVVQACFAGRRIVVFSGGDAAPDDASLFEVVRGLRDGGANGSNTFTRPREKAMAMLDSIVDIYLGKS
jgi:class I fructose-bisphosphate aldolase